MQVSTPRDSESYTAPGVNQAGVVELTHIIFYAHLLSLHLDASGAHSGDITSTHTLCQ